MRMTQHEGLTEAARTYLDKQAVLDHYPWSSGPVIFLALEDENGNPIEETLWDKETIDNA